MSSPRAESPPIWPGDRNVVLTGFMGTGKSTVGRCLASRLGYDFVDTDDLIESRHGSIASIFKKRGEDEFRLLERAVASELASSRQTVIATGGRLMLDDISVAALAPASRICCLVAPADEVIERVSGDAERHDRPLLNVDDPRRRVEELMAARDDRYRRFLRISASGRTPDTITDDIIAALAPPRRQQMAATDVVVGAALLTATGRLFAETGRVGGPAGPRFAAQVVTGSGSVAVVVGADRVARPTAGDVYVPTHLDQLDASSEASGVLVDVAVLQDALPGFVAWDEVMARVMASW